MSFYYPSPQEHRHNSMVTLITNVIYYLAATMATTAERIMQEFGVMARVISDDITSCDRAGAIELIKDHATLLFPVLLPGQMLFEEGTLPRVPRLFVSVLGPENGCFVARVTFGAVGSLSKTCFLYSAPTTSVPGALQSLLDLTGKLLMHREPVSPHLPAGLEVVKMSNNEGGFVRQISQHDTKPEPNMVWWNNSQTTNPAFYERSAQIEGEITAKESDYFSEDED